MVAELDGGSSFQIGKLSILCLLCREGWDSNGSRVNSFSHINQGEGLNQRGTGSVVTGLIRKLESGFGRRMRISRAISGFLRGKVLYETTLWLSVPKFCWN
ncbi:hypothetical protein GQ457_12G031910 [Hibiscus cannabinus]